MVEGGHISIPDTGWSEQDSADFIAYGPEFTPEGERLRETVLSLLAPVIADSETPYIVELCCGAGQLSAAILERFSNTRMTALDGSPAMLAETQANCAAHADRLDAKLFNLAESDWREVNLKPTAFVSSLAVHHLDGPQKQRLFQYLYRALNPGGVFVLVDIVLPTTPVGLEIAAKQWEETVRAQSITKHGDLRALDAFKRLEWNFFLAPDADPIDKPSSLADQCIWMRESGFEAVDVSFCLAGHAILSGLKPDAERR
ncbi:MAG: class I SAM-dependent methyltransferase [Alphaproteobacteria bacterium]|nr:class I SAM-dependent methyltransferase [Alphaproteobacteria bacterium]